MTSVPSRPSSSTRPVAIAPSGEKRAYLGTLHVSRTLDVYLRAPPIPRCITHSLARVSMPHTNSHHPAPNSSPQPSQPRQDHQGTSLRPRNLTCRQRRSPTSALSSVAPPTVFATAPSPIINMALGIKLVLHHTIDATTIAHHKRSPRRATFEHAKSPMSRPIDHFHLKLQFPRPISHSPTFVPSRSLDSTVAPSGPADAWTTKSNSFLGLIAADNGFNKLLSKFMKETSKKRSKTILGTAGFYVYSKGKLRHATCSYRERSQPASMTQATTKTTCCRIPAVRSAK